MNEEDVQQMNRAIFTDGHGCQGWTMIDGVLRVSAYCANVTFHEPLRDIIMENPDALLWGCHFPTLAPDANGAHLNDLLMRVGLPNGPHIHACIFPEVNPSRAQERAGRVTESDVGRPDD